MTHIRLGAGPSAWCRPMGVAVIASMWSTVLAGCVQIDTPDKPIEINLNINIRQEVIYRLDSDARRLIEENEEIF